jgi:hypothetical protein
MKASKKTRKTADVESAEVKTAQAAATATNAKREAIPAAEIKKVESMPRNIQCFLLRKSFSIGQIADALGIKASSVPTNAKAGEKAVARLKGLAGVIEAIPEK